MQQNDKILCRVTNYFPSERTFEVETLESSVKGYVTCAKNYHDIPILKDAYKEGLTIHLYFDHHEEGKALFSYREVKHKKVEITALFSHSDKNFNISLFDALYNSIGDVIDTEDKYNIAKQLLTANKYLKIRKGLPSDLFKMSIPAFQQKFWEEGFLPYFSNYGIRNKWSNADDEEKQSILQKLGIIIQPQLTNNIECYFEEIGSEVLRNLKSAKKSIKIAMAWFTNFDIYNVIKEKLKDADVEITLVTNNDLINNGGYCLNLNDLIQEGLKLYIYEYPEMLHHKFCIIDDEVLMTGSYNWTFFSEEVNRENILVIRDNEKLVSAFSREFEYLISERTPISEMPNTAPERPEYDRSSFKQYICEELVIRARKRIGDVQENIRRAHELSPSSASVANLMQDLNMSFDNTSVSTRELELTACQTAVEQRQERINSHNAQLRDLNKRRESLEANRAEVTQSLESIRVRREQVSSNIEISESERRESVEAIDREELGLQERQERLSNELQEVEMSSTEIENEVQQTSAEISIIESTMQTQTEGGRGSLKINLKWATTDDLDLHVFDPNGSEIFFSTKEQICNGVLGRLDVDANACAPYTSTPQENIYWEEGKNAPLGNYKVKVVLYNKRSGIASIPFQVTVYPTLGEPKVFPGFVNTEKEIVDVVEFEYTDLGIIYK